MKSVFNCYLWLSFSYILSQWTPFVCISFAPNSCFSFPHSPHSGIFFLLGNQMSQVLQIQSIYRKNSNASRLLRHHQNNQSRITFWMVLISNSSVSTAAVKVWAVTWVASALPTSSSQVFILFLILLFPALISPLQLFLIPICSLLICLLCLLAWLTFFGRRLDRRETCFRIGFILPSF